MRRVFGYLLLGLLTLLMLAVGLTAFGLYTQTGTGWLLGLAMRYAPGTLHIDHHEGALADRLVLTGIDYQAPVTEGVIRPLTLSATNLALDLEAAALWFDGELRILRLQLIGARVVPAQTEPAPPTPLDIELPGLPAPLTIEALHIEDTRIDGVPAAWTPDITAALRWDRDGAALDQLALSAPAFRLTGDLRAGSATPGVLTGQMALSVMDPRASTTITLSGSLAQPELTLAIVEPAAASADLAISLAGRIQPEVSAKVRIPAWDQPPWTFRATELAVSGTAAAYELQLQTRLVYQNQAPVQIDLQGSGSTEQFVVQALTLRDAERRLSAAGSMRWHDQLQFELTASAGTNQLRASGHLDNDWPQASIEFQGPALAELAPQLRGRLEFAGRIGGSRQRPELALQLDGSELRMGEAALAELRGRIQLADNQAAAELDADELTLPGWGQLADLRLRAQADQLLTSNAQGLDRDHVSWQLRVDAARLAADAGGILTALHLTGKGGLQQQQVSLDYRLDDAPGHLAAELTWMERPAPSGPWRGRISGDTYLALPGMRLTPTADVVLTGQADRITLQSHCWQSAAGSLCFDDGAWSPEAFALSGALRIDQPQALLGTRLPGWQLEGELAGTWQLRGPETLTGGADLTLSGGRVARALGEETDTLAERVEGRLQVDIADPGVTGRLQLQAAGDNSLQAQLAAGGFERDARLTGTARLAIGDLGILDNWTAQLPELRGSLETTATLAGTLAQPALTLDAALRNGAGIWRDPRISFSELTLDANVDPDGRLAASGTAQVGADGKLQLTADGQDLFAPARQLTATLRGSALGLQQDNMTLVLSPDLQLQSAPDVLQVRGHLTVDSAEVALKSLPESAVARAPDVVVVGAEREPAATSPVETDIRIELGDKVHFTAFGLDTRLAGDLHLRSERQRAPQLTGRVELRGGTFSAFGQSLAINRGTLTFTGALDNPFVDVRAIRDIEGDQKIQVGVHVQGPANRLQSTLFSDPALPEADVLSYLLLGRRLNESSSAEGNQLANAAIGLGLRTAAPVIDTLRQNFGLDELGAEGVDDGDVAIVAGKRISNDLYVRYTYRAFSQFGSLLLDYTLSRRWRLEASASQNPSVDLIYKIGGD